MKKISAIAMVSILIFGLFLNFEVGIEDVSAYIPHGPIFIDGNSDFANQSVIEGWAGNGSESSPYIIENYSIDASTDIGIEIRNTDVFFIIRDCWIENGMPAYKGILFHNVTHGSIEDTIFYLNDGGIELISSSNNTISFNDLQFNNLFGIYIHTNSNNNTVFYNIFSHNSDGIHLELSSDNTISNNTIGSSGDYGIYVNLDSLRNTISNNSIFKGDDGMHIEGNYNTILNNSIDSNLNDGIVIGGVSNTVFSNSVYNNSNGINGLYINNNIFKNIIYLNN